MPQLRLILLVLGVAFLAGLAIWEKRRGHQARGSELPRAQPEPPEPAPRSLDWDLPALELPRMSARDPDAQLPVVQVEPLEFAALQAQAYPGTDAPPQAPFEGRVAPVDPIEVSEFEPEPEPRPLPDGEPPSERAPSLGGVDTLIEELGASQLPDPPISDITESFRAGTLADETFEVEAVTVRSIDTPRPAATAPPSRIAEPASISASAAPAPAAPAVVDWPAAEASQVLAVRLVSHGEKFSGRAVRLALAAEGFALGKFAIFHKAGPDGRALLSVASLNKPGTFDAHSIDLQRYSGLNLFTVLPGPVPGSDAVDEMLMCAQVLSQRLRGTLQDEQGAPLTPTRTAVMRSAAAAAGP